MNKYWEHFKLICRHKKYVWEACCKAGIPWQGFIHDLSKFSPIEFFESAKYFTGNESPIKECKRLNGYSLAWFHHKGRNKHHWEYWLDEATPAQMPFKYALEMLCDYIGAGKAYQGKDFTWESELEWWQTRREKVILHPVVWAFVENCLTQFAKDNGASFNKNYCLAMYTFYNYQFKDGLLKGRYKSVI